MKKFQIKAPIISNNKYRENYWHIEFDSDAIAQISRPGQFISIRVSENFVPLLRRPLSIHQVRGSKIKLIYAVKGEGTLALSKRKQGELLDIIGPLGNGFNYKEKEPQSILVAGGMGVAPLVFLAQKIRASKPLVLIGARSKQDILCQNEFKDFGCGIKLATEDGSAGFKGYVTDLLKKVLIDTRCLKIFACGPRPMLKSLKSIAEMNKISAELSLEEHMACGIGACLGCVVSTKNGYKRVCKDGPVFLSEELTW